MDPAKTATDLATALGELQHAVHTYVKANSTLEMGGRKYSKPSVKALADALEASYSAVKRLDSGEPPSTF